MTTIANSALTLTCTTIHSAGLEYNSLQIKTDRTFFSPTTNAEAQLQHNIRNGNTYKYAV